MNKNNIYENSLKSPTDIKNNQFKRRAQSIIKSGQGIFLKFEPLEGLETVKVESNLQAKKKIIYD